MFAHDSANKKKECVFYEQVCYERDLFRMVC